MFRETLLESAPGARRRKRWPMLLAVVLEVAVCSVLVALPLFSSGTIPVSARTVIDSPRFEPMPIVDSHRTGNAGGRGPVISRARVVTIADGRSRITFGPPVSPSDNDSPVAPNISGIPSGPAIPICVACDSGARPRGPGQVRISVIEEGQLLRKVEPVYPRPALLAGIHGEVRMHAIIARDGTIQSLTVISGHPLLAKAAMDAVGQWQYRPYVLNREPVEVDTFITVSFK